jgi:hypothetical protein
MLKSTSVLLHVVATAKCSKYFSKYSEFRQMRPNNYGRKALQCMTLRTLADKSEPAPAA